MFNSKEVPLIGYQDLKAVPPTSPDYLNHDLLFRTHSLVTKLTIPNTQYIAIAHNQIPPNYLHKYSLPEQHLRILYFSKLYFGNTLYDRLWINPQIIPANDRTCHLEGCGSIPGLKMFIDRPRTAVISGFSWKPGEDKPQERTLELTGLASATFEHEQDHLEGKTALSRHPIDFRTSIKKLIINLNFISYEKNIAEFAKKYPHHHQWLITDENTGKFEIIDSNGKFIKQFN